MWVQVNMSLAGGKFFQDRFQRFLSGYGLILEQDKCCIDIGNSFGVASIGCVQVVSDVVSGCNFD